MVAPATCQAVDVLLSRQRIEFVLRPTIATTASGPQSSSLAHRGDHFLKLLKHLSTFVTVSNLFLAEPLGLGPWVPRACVKFRSELMEHTTLSRFTGINDKLGFRSCGMSRLLQEASTEEVKARLCSTRVSSWPCQDILLHIVFELGFAAL